MDFHTVCAPPETKKLYSEILVRAALENREIVNETNTKRKNYFGDHKRDRQKAIRKTSCEKIVSEKRLHKDKKKFFHDHLVTEKAFMFLMFILEDALILPKFYLLSAVVPRVHERQQVLPKIQRSIC